MKEKLENVSSQNSYHLRSNINEKKLKIIQEDKKSTKMLEYYIGT